MCLSRKGYPEIQCIEAACFPFKWPCWGISRVWWNIMFPWPMFSICTHFRHVSSQRGVETWKPWCLWVIDPVTCSSGLRPWPRHRCSAFATHKCKSWWLLCISSICTLCRNEYIYIHIYIHIYIYTYIYIYLYLFTAICTSVWVFGCGDLHMDMYMCLVYVVFHPT
jgi:hypothetical protein